MEDIRQFNKGMHSDFDEQNQPELTYRNATNWIRGLDGSLTSEYGTVSALDIPLTKSVIGSFILEGTMVVFLLDVNGNHEIGYISNKSFTSVLVTSLLNFNVNNIVKGKGRIDYRGHRLVYFVDGLNPSRVIDLDKDYSGIVDIEGELKLQLDSELPEVNFDSIDDGGELPTGVYQFQARLLTSSTNKGIVGLPTNPIPVINDISSVPDGAPPGTPSTKRINLTISNIDSKFKFVEIIAISYEGLANVPKVSIVGRRQIVGDTMQFSYSSTSQIIEETTLDDVTVEPVIYTAAKFIDYKDGHLLQAGLKVKKRQNSLQSVANNIKVEYVIQELDFTESISLTDGNRKDLGRGDYFVSESDFKVEGYALPENTINLKGLRRQEVYSISITPLFTDGTTGNACHIPAPAVSTQTRTTSATKITGIKGKTGTYLSDAVYPVGFGYPEGRVRHHVMPDNNQEPVFAGGKIRVLGLKLSNIDLSILPEDERKEIKGYIIGYQRRTSLNKSIITQGIAQPLVRHRGSDETFVSPFHGKGSYLYGVSGFGTTTYKTADWKLSGEAEGTGNNPIYYKDAVAFYSPETILTPHSPINADYIDKIGMTSGKAFLAASEFSNDGDNRFAHVFMNFDSITYGARQSVGIIKDTIANIPTENATGNYTPQNFKIPSKSISTRGNNGCLFFHTTGGVSFWNNDSSKDTVNGISDLAYQAKDDATDCMVYIRDGVLHGGGNADQVQWSHTSRAIYNLRRDLSEQYGDISSAEYVYLTHTLDATQGIIEVFNGDTFINKVGIMSCTAEPNNELSVGQIHRTLSYVFLESSINTNYRHYVVAENDAKGTVPYFPKVKSLWSKEGQNGLFQIDPKLGHSNGYNTQYSFDNGLKKYFPIPLLMEEEVEEFPNRCIYSEVSLEGEQFDANRVFLPNNYQDIPKHKGSISDMFIHNGSLYFHTPQTLFKAFFNEQVTQVTSAGEVALGNGGAFSRPAMEIFTISGGYAGTNSTCGVNTPFGRIFIDELQGKIFMLGEGVQEISIDGMSEFFKAIKVLPDTLKTGYTAVYDYSNRRYILACKDRFLMDTYASKYKGEYREEDMSFISTLRSGDIVSIRGVYKRIV